MRGFRWGRMGYVFMEREGRGSSCEGEEEEGREEEKEKCIAFM